MWLTADGQRLAPQEAWKQIRGILEAGYSVRITPAPHGLVLDDVGRLAGIGP